MTELPMGMYRHYKGHLCEVIGTALHSETLEKLVVYRHSSEEFGENQLWARPLLMFLETVIVDGKEIPRFSYLGKAPESPTT